MTSFLEIPPNLDMNMKTPEEILDEVAAENMINIHQMVTTKKLAILAMERYAILYHENELKKLNNLTVSNSLNLSELECKLDAALGKETREILTEWIKQQR